MFGILAERLSSFVLKNGSINTAVQKAGISGFPGCLEHTSMICHTIQEAKRLRKKPGRCVARSSNTHIWFCSTCIDCICHGVSLDS